MISDGERKFPSPPDIPFFARQPAFISPLPSSLTFPYCGEHQPNENLWCMLCTGNRNIRRISGQTDRTRLNISDILSRIRMIDPTVIIVVVGVAAFAISGVIAGARQDANILTVLVLGVVTAIGGGTLRDIILNIPVFWVGDFTIVWLAILASLLAFLFSSVFREKMWKALQYADAIGLAFFSVAAIDKTLALGHSGEVAVIMGFVTACTGGIIRDLLTGRPPMIIASEELFVTPVLVGGILYVLLLDLAPQYAAQWSVVAICFITGFRSIAIKTGLQFPKWLRMRPGKRAG